MKKSVSAKFMGMRDIEERKETYYKFEVTVEERPKIYFMLEYGGERVLLDNVFDTVPLTLTGYPEIYRVCHSALQRIRRR